MKSTIFVCAASAMLLAACGGGGSGTGTSPQPVSTPGSVSTQAVSGTLVIGNPGSTALSTGRRPLYVSTATGHVALFIDGAATTAGQTSTCTASTGTGTGCTITWAAQLTVPAAHTFAVETDTGTTYVPYNTILSEGAGSYAIVAGSANALTALSLNGIVKDFSFQVVSCAGTTPNSSCSIQYVLEDATGNNILYTGTAAVGTTGNSPTSGSAFDNAPLTLVSSAPSIGTITAGPGNPLVGTLTAGTVSLVGVTSYGYPLSTVTCGSGTTGSFGLTIGAAAPSHAVTVAEAGGLTPAVSFPTSTIIVLGTPLTFTCTAGNITSSGGSLTVN